MAGNAMQTTLGRSIGKSATSMIFFKIGCHSFNRPRVCRLSKVMCCTCAKKGGAAAKTKVGLHFSAFQNKTDGSIPWIGISIPAV